MRQVVLLTRICGTICSMKKISKIVVALAFAANGAVAADSAQKDPAASTNAPPKIAASKVRVKCPVCRGRGSLTVRPPDHGQYGGRIESRSHWDIKLDPCPICEKGHGYRIVWDLAQPEPSTEPPCMSCGWSGLVQCRKCLASGLVKCTNRDCKDGWIVTKAQSAYRRSSSRKPPTVTQCRECKGVGKIICPECKGMRAELCKRCFGTGRKLK